MRHFHQDPCVVTVTTNAQTPEREGHRLLVPPMTTLVGIRFCRVTIDTGLLPVSRELAAWIDTELKPRIRTSCHHASA